MPDNATLRRVDIGSINGPRRAELSSLDAQHVRPQLRNGSALNVPDCAHLHHSIKIDDEIA
ncbi:MAG TPA: hypothetical protein VIO13_11365 [Candidatus Dormibacteraeota bacterium]